MRHRRQYSEHKNQWFRRTYAVAPVRESVSEHHHGAERAHPRRGPALRPGREREHGEPDAGGLPGLGEWGKWIPPHPDFSTLAQSSSGPDLLSLPGEIPHRL